MVEPGERRTKDERDAEMRVEPDRQLRERKKTKGMNAGEKKETVVKWRGRVGVCK